jgi:hypothetical protein
MTLNSNKGASGELLNTCQRHRMRLGTLEPETGPAIAACDHAKQRLAEGAAPGAHGAQIARAGARVTVRVRVMEADDVMPTFLTPQGARAIELDPSRTACGIADATH